MAIYQIEISGPRNESVLFHPTGQRLRGRWDFGKTAHRDKNAELKELAFNVPVIPGIAVAVNTEQRVAAIFDPLSTEEGKKIMQRINDTLKRSDSGYEPHGPWERVEHKLDANGLKEWLYWMRRLVDGKMAEEIGGAKLPSMDEIRAMPGRRRADPGRDGEYSAKSPDTNEKYGLYPWADEVPLDAASAKGKGKEPAATA